MKVCTIDPPRDLPKDMSDSISGFIEFDADLDRLMAIAESVTLYGFDWRRKGAAQVRRFLRKTLFKYKLNIDKELFEKAYGYIRENY